MSHRHKTRITAVILAAGQSTRMGAAKLLLPWGDTTIVGETIRQVQASTAEQVLLVSGGYRAEVEAIAAEHGVPVVFNSDFAEGEMLSSLKRGVSWVQAQEERSAGILVMLGDLPFLPTAVLDAVMHTFRQHQPLLTAPVYAGQRGHPVLIHAQLWRELLALPPHSAPRDLLKRYHHSLLTVPVATDVILRDIDTPEQYAAWPEKWGADASIGNQPQ